MRLCRVVAFAFLCFLTLFPALGFGQLSTNDTGIHDHQMYVGDHENINPVTGNVNIQIPLVTLPQRGGKDFTLYISYNSNIWVWTDMTTPSGNHDDWGLESVNGQTIGWALGLPYLNYSPASTIGNVRCDRNFVIAFPDGGKHSFAATANCAELVGGNNWIPIADSGPVDGSDFAVFNPDTHTAILRDGTQLIFPAGQGQHVGTIEDRNGNQIIFGSNLITDTAGRQITFSGDAGGNFPASIGYKASDGTPASITLATTQVTINASFPYTQATSPNPWQNSGNGTHTFLSSITLANGTAYTFSYNSYGELSKITYPTGGYTRYDYDNFSKPWSGLANGYGNSNNQRMITAKHLCRLSNGACTTQQEDTTFYSVCAGGALTSPCPNGYSQPQWTPTSPTDYAWTSFTTTITDPLGNQTVLTRDNAGHTHTHIYNQGTLLRTIDRTLNETQEDYDGTFLQSELLTLDGGSQTQTTWTYDTYTRPGQTSQFPIDDPVDVKTTGYDGKLLRETKTTYFTPYRQATPHIYDLPTQIQVLDGQGTLSSETDNSVDDYSSYSLAGFSAANHDSTYGTSYTSRGNITKVTHTLVGGTSPISYTQFDTLGNAILTKDPNGNTTTYSYADDFASVSGCAPLNPTYANLTQVTDALGQLTQNSYYYCSGLLQARKDPNDVANGRAGTTFAYDNMRRLLSVNDADGGSKSTSYNDLALPATVTTVVASGPGPQNPHAPAAFNITGSASSLTSSAILDGLGRTTATHQQTDSSGDIVVSTTYDGIGRVQSRSNPYYSSASSYGTTQFSYDALDRPTTTTLPDGSSDVHHYASNCDTHTDPASHALTWCYDSLQRLTSAAETSPADTQWVTSYSYNAMGNLTGVNQPGDGMQPALTRNFQYDSLSRLTSAQNPESGTITYGYDANGNMINRTDALGQTTQLQYDALNRLVSKAYPNAINATPGVTFIYGESQAADGTPLLNSIDRLTTEYSGTGASGYTREHFSYDAMGRVWNEYECTPNTCPSSLSTGSNLYNHGYMYRLDGSSWASTLPYDLSGNSRTLTYSDDQTGRLRELDSSLNDQTHPGQLLYNIQNGLFGANSTTFGNGVIETRDYQEANTQTHGWLRNVTATLPNSTSAQGTVTIGGSEESVQTSPAQSGSTTITISGAEQGPIDVTNSTGSVTINGSLQTKKIPGVAGTGYVSISGSEQSWQTQSQAATSGSGSVSISGSERFHTVTYQCGQYNWCQLNYPDSGYAVVTINGTQYSYNWGPNDTSATVASGLASQINGGSVATSSASGSTVFFTARATGSASNYSLSVSSYTTTTQYFTGTSFPATASGPNLSGGQDAQYVTNYDSGTTTITVNGHGDSVNWGNGSNSSTIASGLASAIDGDGSAAVTASASGSTVYLTAKSQSAASDYSLSTSITSQRGSFGSSASGPSLTGGQNPYTIYDSGSATITVNGHGNSYSWSGSGTTAAGIASNLANVINADSAAYVTASVSGTTVNLMTKATGSGTSYSLGSSYTYDATDFSASSFTTSNSGAAMTLGPATLYDQGTVTVTVNGHSDAASYGQGSSGSSIASALAGQINGDSPYVGASASGNVLTLTAKTQGSGTDYGYTASAVSSETSTFPSGSFSVPVSGTLGGGADAQYAYDTGTVSITVGGHVDSVSYGQSSTAGGIASALESAINNDSAAPASAALSGLVLTLTNKTAGTSGDVMLQSSVSSSANFNPVSFSAAASGASLTGGATAGTVYSLGLSYYPDGSVQNANGSVTGNWTYNYDSLNRLTGGTNSTGGALSWSYDAFGNRSSQSASGTLTGNYNQPTFLFSNNRIQGYCYDANGNLLDAGPCPSGQHQYAYDAENRLIRAGSTTYQYDAEGRRVSNGTWEYLYDRDGNAVTLLDANAHSWVEGEVFAAGRHVATYANNTTYFVHPDHLGTERARSDVFGNGCEWTATLPFGDLQSDTGACAGVTRRLFTGKERDSESGFDYFGGRYYSSAMGRWISPDWSALPEPVPYADLSDPQTLNLYSYVKNNPMSHADTDGHCCDLMDVVDFFAGAANAYGSDNVLGAGRMEQNTNAGRIGAGFGDAGATIQGAGEFLGGAGVEGGGILLDSTGVGALLGVPANVAGAAMMLQGGSTAAIGGANLFKDANQTSGTYQATPENVDKMDAGKAPTGNDGHPVELHHPNGDPNATPQEMTRSDHRLGENYKKNHPNANRQASRIDRSQANRQRQKHWKDEAQKQRHD